jgi:hypothetical protein
VPLTVVVSITALYAIFLRMTEYGLTVARFWALFVAGVATMYSIGYSIAAISPKPWLSRISMVNVTCAFVVIAVIVGSLTPLLSPYRLSANSQFKLAALTTRDFKNWNSPFPYLRFNAGQYGLEKLHELAAIQNGPNAESIRALAQTAINMKVRWGFESTTNFDQLVSNMPIFPAGKILEAQLKDQLLINLRDTQYVFFFQKLDKSSAAGLFIDLNGDNKDEFIFLTNYNGLAYEKTSDDRWKLIGSVKMDARQSLYQDLIGELTQGKISTAKPAWKELNIGNHKFRIDE